MDLFPVKLYYLDNQKSNKLNKLLDIQWDFFLRDTCLKISQFRFKSKQQLKTSPLNSNQGNAHFSEAGEDTGITDLPSFQSTAREWTGHCSLLFVHIDSLSLDDLPFSDSLILHFKRIKHSLS